MANYTNLKSTINAQIKANGTGAITGPVLNGVLRDMVSALGEAGYLYKGVATPATSPGTPDSNVFYIASTAGTYTNFGGKVVADGEVAILKYNGSWAKEVTGAATAAQVTQLGQDVAPIVATVNDLGWASIYAFDKTKPSYAVLNSPIVLSQEGDSIEFYVTNVPSTQNMTGGGYTFAGKNGSTRGNIALSYTGSVWVRADDDTWILQYGNGATGSTRRVKIVYNASSIDFYVDGTKVSTYNSLKAITIYSFGNANNTSNYGYWSGQIEELKVNGLEVNLSNVATLTNVQDLGNHSFLSQSDLENNLESTATKKALTANQGKVLKGLIDNIVTGSEYDEPISALGGWEYVFNGTSSKLLLNQSIVLQNNGDYIEIGIASILSPSLFSGGYGFCVNGTNIRIGLSVSGLFVRADDDTWIFQRSVDVTASVIKLSYESGNIVLYLDGVSTATYSGQKKMTIGCFGYGNPSYGYWHGAITYIEANGERINIQAQNNTDVLFTRDNGFLTDEQASLLSSSLGEEMYVSKTATQMDVYIKLPNGQYIHYPFSKRYSAYSQGAYPSYYDNWGIGAVSLADFSGVMTENASLFSPGEAELAVSVPDGNDPNTNTYVGGQAHGFENIVTGDNGRELSILVNNQRISEDEVIALTPADKVEVVQHTQICQAHTNSNPFADVTKHWIWENGKMSCTTSVKVVRSILFRYAQFGMMCVYRRWLGDVNNNYLTNSAIKNSNPYKVWDVSDGWSGMLQSPDPNCTRIVEYGQRSLGFSMSIKTESLQENGGMFVATNGLAYNKIYFDMGRSFIPSVNDILEGTQTWEIF